MGPAYLRPMFSYLYAEAAAESTRNPSQAKAPQEILLQLIGSRRQVKEARHTYEERQT